MGRTHRVVRGRNTRWESMMLALARSGSPLPGLLQRSGRNLRWVTGVA